MKTCLDLNKENIRRDIVFRLKLLGYEIDEKCMIICNTVEDYVREINKRTNDHFLYNKFALFPRFKKASVLALFIT